MEGIYAGWLSVLPAVIAIILTLVTKQVIVSLLAGICTGTLIYSLLAGMNPLTGTITAAARVIVQSADVSMLIGVWFLGMFIATISMTNGQHALAKWLMKKVKGKVGISLATVICGICLFISDTFHCFSMGAITRPLAKESGISREKLSYWIDASAAPVCCLSPVGTWMPAIIALIPAAFAANGTMTFVSSIPFNFYCILSILMCFWICFPKHDFATMLKAEQEFTGILSGETVVEEEKEGHLKDMVLLLALLIVLSFFFIFQTGGMFSEGRGPVEALANCEAIVSIASAAMVTVFVGAILIICIRKTVTMKDFFANIMKEGIQPTVDICMLLVFAWGLAGTCRNLLQTGPFLADLLVSVNFPMVFLPVVLFVICSFFSFATGTSWGTFGIAIPIAFEICAIAAPELITICVAAILSGACFGDNCSPISDTTLMASFASEVEHIRHVETQIPYSLTCAVVGAVGFIIAGITKNVVLSLVPTVILFFLVVKILSKKANAKINA